MDAFCQVLFSNKAVLLTCSPNQGCFTCAGVRACVHACMHWIWRGRCYFGRALHEADQTGQAERTKALGEHCSPRSYGLSGREDLFSRLLTLGLTSRCHRSRRAEVVGTMASSSGRLSAGRRLGTLDVHADNDQSARGDQRKTRVRKRHGELSLCALHRSAIDVTLPFLVQVPW